MLLMIMKKMDNDNTADNAKTKANNDHNDWLLFKSKGIVPYRT